MRKTFSLPVAATAAGGGVTPPPADTVDNIEHSVRFNSADNAYLSRTPSSAGNRKTWTWSGWVKIGKLGTRRCVFGSTLAGNDYTIVEFNATDNLVYYETGATNGVSLVTTAVYRDPSAWYHIVLAVDTTAGNSADRQKLYVNGVQVTDFSTENSIAQDYNTRINDTIAHDIGREGTFGYYWDGYQANIHFVDGQALTPSSFGFTDSNGIWQPKAYSGSYGTNGYHLDFADTSSATALGNDVSGNNNDWTPNNLVAGPAYTANSFSTEFDGNGDYLSIPSSTDLQFGTGDWTIEHWVYIPSGTSMLAYWRSSVGVSGDSNTVNAATIYFGSGQSDSTVISEPAFIGPSNSYRLYSGVDIRGQWTHVAVTKASNTVRLFVDGILKASQSDSYNYNATGNTLIGVSNLSNNNYFLGKISNVRVIKGRALYTAAFTPPSTALTATDDTVLLTCQDATVRDNSNIGHDVTASGDVAVVNEGPFNGYSGSFDGSGDYLTVPASSDWEFTGDYTIEFWLYQSVNAEWCVYDTGGSGSADQFVHVGGIVYWGYGTTDSVTGPFGLGDINRWIHWAVTRSGNVTKMFKNGVVVDTNTAGPAANIGRSNADLWIGARRDPAYYVNGKISNLRITKGQALYTADFTPPTADLTTTSQGATASNVKLLTCQDSTFIDNSPSAHTITVNGDAHPVSVNPHTDKYSVTFDGTGDYLESSGTPFNPGTGDFTVEWWQKLATTNTNYSQITFNSNGGFKASNSAFQFFSDGDGINIAGSTTYTTDWEHIAFVRSSGVVYFYHNGISVPANIINNNGSNSLTVDRFRPGDSFATYSQYNGKISNLRVTNGQALYTSNFLPPTEDFTTTSQGATASNVKLLTCQSYKVQDNSPSAHTITVNGDAKPSTDAPFVTSGAGSFDGTGDYLSIPTSTDLALGSGDWTVEAWVNADSTGYAPLIAWRNSAVSSLEPDLYVWNTGVIAWYVNNQDRVIGTTNIVGAGWVHVAVCKSGSSTKLFVNGTQEGSTYSDTNTYLQPNTALKIGALVAAAQYFDGKISNVRISKGLARYTANFTPPTEDFDPTDQDTTFLALQGNTLDDLAGDHAVSALGNAATSTVSPFEPVDGSDAMLDSPTNYGSGDTVRGNFCTLNPLDKNSSITLSDGNLKATGGSGWKSVRATFGMSSGKWYWEAAANTSFDFMVGITKSDAALTSHLGASASGWAYYLNGGTKWNNGSSSSYGATCAVNDAVGIAFDADNGTLVFYKNGVSQGTAFTGLTSGPYFPTISTYGNDGTVNFGQQPFKYPLAGYKSLCSTNLPTPAVADGSTAMDVVTYTGNGGTQTISTPNLSPDLIWLKRRNTTGQHVLTDIVRGTNSQLYSSSTNSEGSDTTVVTAFNSAGFELGSGPVSFGNTNTLNSTYVGWVWDAGSSTVSNTDGAITSQVRANPTAGISVVSYTGTLTAAGNTTVGHGLSNAPALVITKGRNETAKWVIQSSALGTNEYLEFSTAAAQSSTAVGAGALPKPTSSVFYTSWLSGLGGNGINHIAYCFAPVEGFSAFGTYTGNGSTDGPFVYTGMRPKWLMIKRTDAASSVGWYIWDSEREGYNYYNDSLNANTSSAEYDVGVALVDILSNGFKLLDTFADRNANGGTYIYAAFAEHPFKTSRAR